MAHLFDGAHQGCLVGSLRGESPSTDDVDACASCVMLSVYVRGRETRLSWPVPSTVEMTSQRERTCISRVSDELHRRVPLPRLFVCECGPGAQTVVCEKKTAYVEYVQNT